MAQEEIRQKYLEYLIQGQYDSARIALEENRQYFDDKKFHLYLGQIYMASEQYSRAISSFETALQNDSGAAQVYCQLAQAYDKNGLPAEAIKAYHEALARKPDFMAAKLQLAALYFRQTNYNATIAASKNIMRQDSVNVTVYLLLGKALMKQAKYDSAILALAKALELDSVNFSCRLNLAMALIEKEEYVDASQILSRLFAKNSTSDAVLFHLGECYEKLEQVSKAIDLYERGIAINGAYRIQCKKALLRCYYQAKAYINCLAIAQNIITEKEDDVISHYYLALALSELHIHEKADAEFEKTLELANVDFINGVYLYQALNAQTMKDYAKTIKIYKKIIAIEPQFCKAYFNLGTVYDAYYRDKQPALRCYEKFLSIARENPEEASLVEIAEKRVARLKETEFFKGSKKTR